MNFRPDHMAWMRMINAWNRKDAAFAEAFTTEDRTVLVRLSSDPDVKVLKVNSSSWGRSSMIVKVRGTGGSKKARARSSSKILVDVFEGNPVNVFIKAGSTKALSRAVLKVLPFDESILENASSVWGEHPSAG